MMAARFQLRSSIHRAGAIMGAAAPIGASPGIGGESRRPWSSIRVRPHRGRVDGRSGESRARGVRTADSLRDDAGRQAGTSDGTGVGVGVGVGIGVDVATGVDVGTDVGTRTCAGTGIGIRITSTPVGEARHTAGQRTCRAVRSPRLPRATAGSVARGQGDVPRRPHSGRSHRPRACAALLRQSRTVGHGTHGFGVARLPGRAAGVSRRPRRDDRRRAVALAAVPAAHGRTGRRVR